MISDEMGKEKYIITCAKEITKVEFGMISDYQDKEKITATFPQTNQDITGMCPL